MKLKHPVGSVLGVYFLCYLFRILEYFLIRTDQSVIGEAFIHKLIGIAVILLVMRQCNYTLPEIGFTSKGILRYLCYGLAFGLSMFGCGYLIEIILLKLQGEFRSVDFYVSSYAVDQNIVMQTGLVFLLICIVGNIINVVMEEGMFRGLFQKILMDRFTFVKAAIISSVLFGLWHMISPIRNYVDGVSSIEGTIANILMLVFTSALIGFKFAMLYRLTGSLYMGMADHFVNNTIVNLLHVTSQSGTDEMMFARITVAQTISFLIVLIVFVRKEKERKVKS